MNDLELRQLRNDDGPALLELHRRIISHSASLVRTLAEIDTSYAQGLIDATLATGLGYGIVSAEWPGRLLGEIHAYRTGPLVFRHILRELTIGVDPDFQGQGLGSRLFRSFLETVQRTRPDILRVELYVRTTNLKALQFYERLGFKHEGEHDRKIYHGDGLFETPVHMAWFNPAFSD